MTNTASKRQLGLIAAIYLSTFICLIDLSSVNLALSVIQSQMNSPMSQLQWIIDVYALCMSGLMLAVGPLSNRLGRKTMWLVGIVIFTVGSLWCALAPDFTQLLLGRLVQGVAGAILIPSALSILMSAFQDPQTRGKVIGGWSSFSALSLVTGPLIGGLLVHYFGWQSIFWINLPIGAVTLYLGYRFIAKDTDKQAVVFDFLGLILSSLSIVSLTYALIALNDSQQTQSAMVAFAVFAMAVFAFIIQQKKATHPLLPKHLLSNADFLSYNAASLFLGLCGYSMLFVFALFYQDILGYSAAQAGWLIAPQFLAQAIVSTQFGKIQMKWGAKKLLTCAYTVSALGLLAMLLFNTQTPVWLLIAISSIFGAGLGLVIPASSLLVMQSVAPKDANITSAIMNTLRQTGMTLGIAIFGSTMAMVGHRINPLAGFHAAIAIGAILLLAFSVFLFLRRQST